MKTFGVRSCLATKTPPSLAVSCVPWLISPQAWGKHSFIHSAIQHVLFFFLPQILHTYKWTIQHRAPYTYGNIHAKRVSSRFHHKGVFWQTEKAQPNPKPFSRSFLLNTCTHMVSVCEAWIIFTDWIVTFFGWAERFWDHTIRSPSVVDSLCWNPRSALIWCASV